MNPPDMPSLPGTRMTWQEYLETYDPEVYWFYTPCGTYQEQKNEDMFWSLRHTDNCDGIMDEDTLDWSSLDGRWGIKGYLKEEFT
jgi:hypothetical protein